MNWLKLAEWLRSNKLSLDPGKSELVIFRSKTKKELDEITIKINKSKLSPVPHVNYLGVVLDEFLSWDAHVNNLCKNCVKPIIFCPNYAIILHKRLVFQYISPCFTHLFYTAPYHGNLLQKPILGAVHMEVIWPDEANWLT